jgi:hypothetical protein
MARVDGSGKHAAPRHAAGPPTLAATGPAPARDRRSLLLLAVGVTSAVVAWGYLVYLAIDFGTAGRDGENRGWVLLGLATVGAIACLFIALLLGTRLAARLRASGEPPPPPRPPGGRRIAR